MMKFKQNKKKSKFKEKVRLVNSKKCRKNHKISYMGGGIKSIKNEMWNFVVFNMHYDKRDNKYTVQIVYLKRLKHFNLLSQAITS